MQGMTINQTVTEEDFRQAYATYYSTYLWTRYRPWFGAMMIASGVYLFTSQPANQIPVAFALILLGCYLFAAKWIYVTRLLRITRRAGRLPATMQVELSENGRLTVSGDGEHSELNIAKLHGFQIAQVGVLIYLQRNMFFILKEEAIGQAGGIDLLVPILSRNGVKRMR